MKFIAMLFAFLSFAVSADTISIYRSTTNGTATFSDRPTVGAKLISRMEVTQMAQAPQVRVVPVSGTYRTGNSDVVSAVTDEKVSAIQDRQRTYASECLTIDQQIDNLSSSRNTSVDPNTGGRLEDRLINELRQKRQRVC